VIDQADVRTRAIARKLRGVEAADQGEAQQLLDGMLDLPDAGVETNPEYDDGAD
jgi:hypothetical protein